MTLSTLLGKTADELDALPPEELDAWCEKFWPVTRVTELQKKVVKAKVTKEDTTAAAARELLKKFGLK